MTVPSLQGDDTQIIEASSDGTLRRSNLSTQAISNRFNFLSSGVKQLGSKLRSSSRGLGQAVQSAGALGSAMSSVPEVNLNPNSIAVCGFGSGAWGSQYAVAGGCAMRIFNKLQLNAGLAYSPSVDYSYGSTPPVAGRLGFSFPIGANSARSNSQLLKKLSNQQDELLSYLESKDINPADWLAFVRQRDDEIAELRQKIQHLMQIESLVMGRSGASNSILNLTSSSVDSSSAPAVNLMRLLEDQKTIISELTKKNAQLEADLRSIKEYLGMNSSGVVDR